MLSCVLIVPVDTVDKARSLAAAMGWGETGNYSVPLSADGSEPASHYGMNPWVTEEFVAMVTNAGAGVLPQELLAAGYPPADLVAVLSSLTVSIKDSMDGHFWTVLGEQNLAEVQASDAF